MRILAALFLCLLSSVAAAKPSRYPPVTQFSGDRYVGVAQGMTAGEVADASRRKAGAKARHPTPHRKPRKRPPGTVDPVPKANIFRAFAEELRNAGPSKSLAGVVAPLATKARAIQATCGSRIISAIRHTYIAGTGGRLSLHASGRAIDIVGNPACIYAQLRGWPGGVSTDYGRVRHVHFSYAPGGSEWGVRFNHYRGGRRHRHARRRHEV